MNASPKHPLVIVSGFLGSGKTTFLRDLMQHLLKRSVLASVIINDFENAAVDAALIQHGMTTADQEIKAISGNCLCCDSSDEFLEAVATIPVAEHGVLLVEVNGATDTLEMISTLSLRPELRNRFWSPLQVTMVDAKRWGSRGPHNLLEREQLSTSTHFRVTRGDEVEPKKFNQVRLRAALGASRALETTPEKFAEELANIIEEDRAPMRAALNTRPRQQSRRSFRDIALPIQGTTPSHHHQLERAFTSMAFQFKERLWQQELDTILCGLPDSILRVKGLVWFHDDGAVPYSFQHVRPDGTTTFSRLDGFQEIIAAYGIDKVPMMMIVIGVRLPEKDLRERFAPYCYDRPQKQSTLPI
jgi:G3E family GTPase